MKDSRITRWILAITFAVFAQAQAPDRPQAVPPAPPAAPEKERGKTKGTAHAPHPRPAFFEGEVALSNGVYYLKLRNGNVFGYYSYKSFPNLYHFDLGFEYFVDAKDGKGGAYLYDFASKHWFYTSPSSFPNLYDFTLKSFLSYVPAEKKPDRYTSSPRVFVDQGTGKKIEM